MLNLSGWRERGFYGPSCRVKREIGAEDLLSRLGKTLQHEIVVLEHQFARNGVRTIVGEGKFLGPHRIAISDQIGERRIDEAVGAARALIAIGTEPYRPDEIPFNGTSVLDSDDFIQQSCVPRSLIAVGS